MKYYRFSENAYDKVGGVLRTPKGSDTHMIKDGKEITGLEDLVIMLTDGEYMPYMRLDIGGNLVNEELKETIEEFIPENYPIEFLPVTVHSLEYGDRLYYVMHFKIIFDVINEQFTRRIPETGSITHLCLDSEKVRGLHIFNSRPYINDIIVSEPLKIKINRRKLRTGFHLGEVMCY